MKDKTNTTKNQFIDLLLRLGLVLLIVYGGFVFASIVISSISKNVKQNLQIPNKPLLSLGSDVQVLRLEVQSLSSKYETLQGLYQKSEKQIRELENSYRALEKRLQDLAGKNQGIRPQHNVQF